MKESRRADRRVQIEAAAQAVLIERGYAGASMLDVAKRAKASNETLYRWYGDKNGLFAAIVTNNASAGMTYLESALTQDGPLAEKLVRFGEVLLRGILSDSAIELNRAAAADATGELGKTIATYGRDTVVPMLEKLLARQSELGIFESASDAAETFLFLLIGDMQARRAIGQLPEPEAAACRKYAQKATERFLILAGVQADETKEVCAPGATKRQ
jgi:AcrR family transcriptional regulator